MGCCSSSKEEINQKFELLISSVLENSPLKDYSLKFIMTQFKYKEISSVINEEIPGPNRRSSGLILKKPVFSKEDEEKYYIIIEFLYKITYPDKEIKESILRKSTKLNIDTNTNNTYNSNSAYTIKNSLKSLKTHIKKEENKEKEQLTKITCQGSISQLSTSFGILLFSITPSYSDLFDIVLKDNPISMFMLYSIGFTKDDSKRKSEVILLILSMSGMKNSLQNFKILLQKYVFFSISFSFKLFDCVMKEKTNGNTVLLKETEMNDEKLKEWIEYNDYLRSNQNDISNRIVNYLCLALINIVNSGYSNDELFLTFQNYSYIEICEIINKFQECINEEVLIKLIDMYPFYFNYCLMRRELRRK